MSTLKKREKCPLHGSYFCCGREANQRTFKNKVEIRGPVTRLPDGREICNPAEMRRRKTIKVREQEGRCAACLQRFDDYREVHLHHRRAKGLGSAFRDDSLANLAAIHGDCHAQLHAGNAELQL